MGKKIYDAANVLTEISQIIKEQCFPYGRCFIKLLVGNVYKTELKILVGKSFPGPTFRVLLFIQ
jgi:hypothetical protein